jgi:thioredoxin reductase
VPVELRRAGRKHLAEFPTVEVRDAAVVDANVGHERLGVRLGDGNELRTRAVVLAHALSYEPPALPGIEPQWARWVFHCPFCDGWEVHERALAVPGSGPDVVRTALVVSEWSSDVVLLTDGQGNACRAFQRPAGRCPFRVNSTLRPHTAAPAVDGCAETARCRGGRESDVT